MTKFSDIYDSFFSKVTDDMYLEWTYLDTLKDLQNILISAIPGFEFPRFKLFDYIQEPLIINTEEEIYEDNSYFNHNLTREEINILGQLMAIVWLQRQITSIENTRMKYSGSDFKMTSQANHLAKLITLKENMQKEDHHYQRLYKRRRIEDDGTIKNNWDIFLTENL